YTVDVFGGKRRAIEAQLAQVDYQKYELLAAYLTLTGNIVTTAITEASLRAQIKATQDIVDIEAKELGIVRKQFKLGGVSDISVLAQETQLEQTRATLPELEKNLAKARNAMAVLIGDFPGNDGLPIFHLDDLHLPENLPVSIPSKLVRQRPDIQAAEALLHASTAQIGVATANLLPQFNLTGAFGTETGNYQSLFGPSTKIWAFQAQVTQAIFNGGALIAQREAAIAAFEASLAQYQFAVLTAFQNVGDTLNALEMDAQTLQANTAAEKAAKTTLDMVSKQYYLGGVSYLNLLYAQMQYHQAYMARIISEATRYADTAALFQSMGGGWWNLDNIDDIDDIDGQDDLDDLGQEE
ncbi:MAG: efflux transporter outer membrane subunit, partial [Gammaproteobacteria bacterium]